MEMNEQKRINGNEWMTELMEMDKWKWMNDWMNGNEWI
jgi:hypothetical protein